MDGVREGNGLHPDPTIDGVRGGSCVQPERREGVKGCTGRAACGISISISA